MRFFLRGSAERRRIVLIVNNSWWCRSDSEQTHKFLSLVSQPQREKLVCLFWITLEKKCQSLKAKPREVRALNLLRTFSERGGRERENSDEEENISTQITFYPVGLLRRMEMSGILSSSSSSSSSLRLATFLWHAARRRSFSTFHRFALIADEWGRESATHRVKQ